jgi:ABC-type dipeptide/oligopeptide/nickel transport system permease component
MLGFIARRLAVSIPVLAGILVVTFALARMVPGEPCKSILGDKATAAMCETFNKKFGFDRSVPEQFFIYAKQLAKGDFGNSIRYSRPVSQILVERFPLTIEMAFLALLLATAVGITLGIISAMRHNTLADVSTMIAANVGISMPVFWLGLMLAYLFGFLLKDTIFWLPPSGRLTAGLTSTPFYVAWGWDVVVSSPTGKFYQFIANHYIFNALITADWVVFRDAIKHMILPVVTLATIPMAIIARMTRSSLLEVLGRDYIRTARAKGLMERRVVRVHALGNAMLPVVTILGLQMGALLGGAVLTETVFGFAGVGRMLVEAINARDYPIVQAFTVIIAVSYMTINIIVDISYSFLDPRVRLQ